MTHPIPDEALNSHIGSEQAACSICGSGEHLQESHGRGGLNDACRPCFFIWYDGVGPCTRAEHGDQKPHIHGEDIRDYCLKAKAAGTWPFTPGQLGSFAAPASGAGRG